MQGNASVSGSTWPYYFLLGRRLASCSRTTSRLLGYLHRQGRWTPFLYREQSGTLLDACLALLFRQYSIFFLLGPVNDRFHVVDVQRDHAIPPSALLAPPVSSPCLDANEEIDFRVTGSPGCWSLQLCQTNQMWKGKLLELLVVKGYWKAVGAKLLHVIDETFCLIPIDSANFGYLDRLTSGASVARYKPTKKGVRRLCVGRLSDD